MQLLNATIALFETASGRQVHPRIGKGESEMSEAGNTRPRAARVLMVVASPATSTTLGGPVGFWASELTHAWLELSEAGYELRLASPAGGRVEVDAMSDPRDASGYAADDFVSRGFLESPAHAALLADTARVDAVDAGVFDALYVAGGQAPMFTFREDPALQRLIRAFWDAGKPVCAVCHGTAALLDVKLDDGAFLIEGKRMTGFANAEEDYVDSVVGTTVMPFRVEDEARARGARFSAAPAFSAHAVRDGQLITGQQQFSGRAAARLLVEALGA
jgi:putative intracellular protease/amidase